MDTMLEIVRVAYSGSSSPHDLLERVARTAQPVLDQGDGVFACLVNSSATGEVVFTDPILLGCQPRIWELARESSTRLTPQEREANLRKPQAFATVSERLGPNGTFVRHWMYAGYRDCGLSDFALLTNMDVDGRGMVLGAPLKRLRASSPRERRQWNLVGAHLRSALRLCSRSPTIGGSLPSDTEAVVTPDGHVRDQLKEHDSSARTALRHATLSIERARQLPTRTKVDSVEALALWRALVAGRWSLVDHFDSDGKRFLVARPNEPSPAAVLEALTPREAQVLAYARMGHSNKLIAYELGLSPAAISEHLHLAMLKLAIRDPSEIAPSGR